MATALLASVGPVFAQSTGASQGTLSMEIANAILVVVQGTVIAAHTVTTPQGRSYSVPTGCRFRYHVPAGSLPLAWRQATDPLFHADGKTCEAAFYNGELTPEFRAAANLPAIPYSCGGQRSCRVEFTSAFLDPVNIEATHLGSEVTWTFNQGWH